MELNFQDAFPQPFIVYHNGQAVQFSPKGWTLFGTFETQRNIDFEGPEWSGQSWIFGASGTWLEINLEFHREAGCSSDPSLDFLTATKAADALIANGCDLPSELRGHETIKTLTPQNAAKIAKGVPRSCDDDDQPSSTLGEFVNDWLKSEPSRTVNSQAAENLSERFFYLAGEFSSLRAIGGTTEGMTQLSELMERAGETLEEAALHQLLPPILQRNVSKAPTTFNLFRRTQRAIEVFGYWNPQTNEICEQAQDGKAYVVSSEEAFLPGIIASVWPERFDEIVIGSWDEEATETEFAARCREENFFSIVGRYAYQCKTLGEWIAKQPFKQADEGGGIQTALGSARGVRSLAKDKEDRGNWMLDNCDPTKLSNLELQKEVNRESKTRGWPLFDSETGNGAFEAYKKAFFLRNGHPFKRDDRGKNKTSKRKRDQTSK
ncbi:hypothetical protein [Roseiconus lacunae]|uniref:hypothetical protein n=1 Tax=Roseiconus lacunae TaxID=2605694 RepID=UPI001E4C8081|nr:hypothetical protein [Roseiconus lacunae]MCD0457935.1 hypothetical protein [Roseiconus lacunae]